MFVVWNGWVCLDGCEYVIYNFKKTTVMIEPGTGLTILGSAIGGAKVIEKILGPTSEYIGEQLKEWTRKKVANTAKIFKNAENKLGEKINQEGKVPPKVLKGILEEGAWCEEDLQVEYFGGVLASSRSGISRDDRGAYFVSLISRLSTYQLRAHYLFYHLIKQQFNGEAINIHDGNNWSNLQMFVSYDTFYKSMDFSEEEVNNWGNILSHAIWGLDKEELLTGFSYGSKDFIKKTFTEVKTDGIIYMPTKIGVELFMWAYGHGQDNANDFFNHELEFPNDQNLTLGEGVSTKKAIEQAKLDKEKNNN